MARSGTWPARRTCGEPTNKLLSAGRREEWGDQAVSLEPYQWGVSAVPPWEWSDYVEDDGHPANCPEPAVTSGWRRDGQGRWSRGRCLRPSQLAAGEAAEAFKARLRRLTEPGEAHRGRP